MYIIAKHKNLITINPKFHNNYNLKRYSTNKREDITKLSIKFIILQFVCYEDIPQCIEYSLIVFLQDLAPETRSHDFVMSDLDWVVVDLASSWQLQAQVK